MTSQSNSVLNSSLKSFSHASSFIVIAIGCLVLLGWAFDILILKSVLPGLVTMKANTALGFALAGVSLWLLQSEQADRRTRRIAQACAATVALLGILTLSEYLFGWNLGIDQLLFHDLQTMDPITSQPGRMAPSTALNFLLLGAALLLLDVETRRGHCPAQGLILVATLISVIAIIGYAYGVQALYNFPAYSSMALHTAAAFLLLSVGLLYARPNRGLMVVISSSNVGGLTARRLLPAAVLIVFGLGWLRLIGQQAGLYEVEFGLALMVACSMAALTVVIWRAARLLDQTDLERGQAEEQVHRNLERIQVLREIDQAITSTLNLDAILSLLLEKIDSFLRYPFASTVMLVNRETHQLEAIACRHLDEAEWKRHLSDAAHGRGNQWIVLETRASLKVLNVQTNPQTRHPGFMRRHGLVSFLGVPLTAKGDDLGVLSIYAKEEHDFSDEEVEFLTTLAGQAAIAIHNSQLYEEMAKLAGDLAKSNRVKDEFLSVMSHELRTPLNVVMGYTGMIKDGILGDINPQQEDALDKVLNRANDQLTMINNVLYATVIETEKVKAEMVEVDLGGFLSNLRTAYHGPIHKNLTLNWDYPPNLPVIKTDSAKLKQILQNLINNAIKFTEKGNVIISAKIRQQATERHEATGIRQQEEHVTSASSLTPSDPHASRLPPHAFVEFRVADTGVGIPKEHLPIIFEKFRQVDSSETRLFGGVGMGLYIVNKLTELLRGKVEVESEPGKGSAFTVTLPLSAVPDDSQADQVHRLHARNKGEGL